MSAFETCLPKVNTDHVFECHPISLARLVRPSLTDPRIHTDDSAVDASAFKDMKVDDLSSQYAPADGVSSQYAPVRTPFLILGDFEIFIPTHLPHRNRKSMLASPMTIPPVRRF